MKTVSTIVQRFSHEIGMYYYYLVHYTKKSSEDRSQQRRNKKSTPVRKSFFSYENGEQNNLHTSKFRTQPSLCVEAKVVTHAEVVADEAGVRRRHARLGGWSRARHRCIDEGIDVNGFSSLCQSVVPARGGARLGGEGGGSRVSSLTGWVDSTGLTAYLVPWYSLTGESTPPEETAGLPIYVPPPPCDQRERPALLT